MKTIIEEFLSLSSTIPDDLVSRLGLIGFEVDELDSVTPAAESCTESVKETKVFVPDISEAQGGTATKVVSTEDGHIQDGSLPQKDYKGKKRGRKKKIKNTLQKSTANLKDVVDDKSSVDVTMATTSVKNTLYVSKFGRRCKRKVAYDERDEGVEEGPVCKQEKSIIKNSATGETAPDNMGSGTETNRCEAISPDTFKTEPTIEAAIDQCVKIEDAADSGKDKHACSFRKCPAVFSSRCEVLEHIKEKHSEDKSRRCSKCKQMFITPDEKRKHTKICFQRLNKVGPFVCETCGKEDIPNVTKLRDHMWNHRRQVQLRERKRHMAESGIKEDPKPTEKLPCEICGKLIGRYGMRNHLFKHSKPMACDLCDAAFAKPNALKMHKLSQHNDESHAKFKCDECGRLFVEMNRCEAHINAVHRKEYNIKCDTCGKAFPSERLLNVHVKVTHAEKIFKCHSCSSAYGLRTQLNRHIKLVHLKQTMFYCRRCKQKFSKKSDMKAHEKAAHPGEFTFRCVVCQKGFNDKNQYRRHLTNVHKLKTIIQDNREMRIVSELEPQEVEISCDYILVEDGETEVPTVCIE